ncbi:hypothetical protein PVK06_024903 [Gossypium arboreum]|uniref:Aminotransferase-like plant mobile domain-containing protein n=1 Tax=Gossypium arboreum TaxID=29729 RepID=A0ABR0PF80_GOSAR|nr:hypothetical protein PVK06_024903 [Gossypium arboreum]
MSHLVEQWRQETHTFHLSCGECTITLEDVALQLRLPIDNIVVTGFSTLFDPETLCYDLLRCSLDNGKFLGSYITPCPGQARKSTEALPMLIDHAG